MKIISLIENTSAREEIQCEHGLSLYIEACGRRILFDMGQSDGFIKNAQRLGVDLSSVDIAVISHGHYDHGGGLRGFLEMNDRAGVYVRRNAFLPYYNGEKYIGLDPDLSQSKRLIFTDGDTEICDKISLTGVDFSYSDGKLTVKRDERHLPDSFDHEQYLLIEEDGKRVLISGCSHKGILPIVRRIGPDVMIGGFHFMNMPLDEELVLAARELDATGCEFYTCHCTGAQQFDFIKKYMKDIKYLSAGDSIEI